MTITIAPVASPKLLNAAGASALLGISRGTLYNLRSADAFAPAIVLGRGTLRWEAQDLLAWARQHKEQAVAA
ncbi:helix-turn-helix domain-containing protein [Rhodoglobus aureus]|uniref:Helix-turn-helix domain-containing protein n=1 Tax=Rhodoglobus aureus TaxID=191497 RepID=A0ABP4GIV8_9MICO